MCSLQWLKGLMKSDKSKNLEGGGIKKIGSLTQTYGNTRQDKMAGKYVGNQCTSIALAAGIHWVLCEEQGRVSITPEMVNDIVYTGHTVHTELRDELGLSRVRDSRIAVDELPRNFLTLKHVFNKLVKFKITGDLSYFFTTHKDYAGLPTLYHHLKKQPLNAAHAYMVTISCYSFVICKSPNSHWSLFDSHGMFEIYKCQSLKDMASSFRFRRLKQLTKFLTARIGGQKMGVMVELLAEEQQRPEVETKEDDPNNNIHVEADLHINPKGMIQIVEAECHLQTRNLDACADTCAVVETEDDTSVYVNFMGCRD